LATQNAYFAKTMLGLETVLRDELAELGAGNLEIKNRGVAFTADTQLFYRILMHTRIALRMLIPIGGGKANKEQELYDVIRTIKWHDHLTLKHTFAIDCLSFHPTMNHNIFLGQKSKDAIVDQFRDRYNLRPDVSPKDPDILINIHISPEGDVTVSLDAGGFSLNQRGYRVATGPAPLNEVLAAGLIRLSGWDPETTFIDPMCGTGTFLIEAALMAKKKAPGLLHNKYSIRRWPDFRQFLWREVQSEAREMVRQDVDYIFGSDIDPKAIDSTIKNLKMARLTQNVKVRTGVVEHIFIPEKPGLIIMNPPYGERIGEMTDLQELYPKIGNMVKHKAKGYKVAIFTGDPACKKMFGLKTERRTSLLNGKIECDFLEYQIF
jgi:putative N6-adenine-specific DNA methylase